MHIERYSLPYNFLLSHCPSYKIYQNVCVGCEYWFSYFVFKCCPNNVKTLGTGKFCGWILCMSVTFIVLEISNEHQVNESMNVAFCKGL